MTRKQDCSGRQLVACAAFGLMLTLGGCSEWSGPGAAAADKANSSGGALGTGMGTVAPSKSGTPGSDGAFAPAPTVQP